MPGRGEMSAIRPGIAWTWLPSEIGRLSLGRYWTAKASCVVGIIDRRNDRVLNKHSLTSAGAPVDSRHFLLSSFQVQQELADLLVNVGSLKDDQHVLKGDNIPAATLVLPFP